MKVMSVLLNEALESLLAPLATSGHSQKEARQTPDLLVP